MISNITRLLELGSKKKNNYNVIKSPHQSHDRFNLFKTILYLLKVDFLLVICYLTYQISWLTFIIIFLNQPSQLTYIELAVSLACAMSLLQTYIFKKVHILLLSYM